MAEGIIEMKEVTGEAAILEKQNEPLAVDEIAIPAYLDTGQVLVRVHASAICGSQLAEISGAAGPDPYLPHLLGHEGGGVVEEIGAGVKHVALGDHVVMHWRRGLGIEANPANYLRENGSTVGAGRVTTFNTYAVVSENRLTAIASDIPFPVAALLGCSVTTGLGIVIKEAQIKPGESVAVFGCGGVGLNVIMGAALAGAFPICVFDIHDKKLRKAIQAGADRIYNLTRLPAYKLGPYEAVVETSGDPAAMAKALQYTTPGGRLILAGLPRFDQDLVLKNLRPHYTGKTVVFSEGGRTTPATDIPRYTQLIREQKINPEKSITHRCKLKDINDAIEMFKTGEAGKIIIKME